MRREEIENVLARLENGADACLQWEIEGTRYIRRFFPAPRLLVLGGGHIAKALCPVTWGLVYIQRVIEEIEDAK